MAEGHLDIAAMRVEASAGSVAAARNLALRLLVGRDAPFDPPEGLSLLKSAAERGDAEALAQLATLAATGAWMPRDWSEGLNLLVRAAEAGSKRAQRQLDILAQALPAAERARLTSTGAWSALKDGVDLDAWLTPPSRRPLCEAPRVRAVENFAPVEACAWLIDLAQGRFKRSMVFNGRTSNYSDIRTCSDFKFTVVDADLVFQILRERMAAVTKLPLFAFEPPQILHYAVGQENLPHYDTLKLGDQGYGADGSYEGDRVATFLLYLNDDYDGGELNFPKVGLRHRGKTGDAVYFANVDTEMKPERLSLHAAEPITRNEKYILSQWIHDRAFTATN